MTQLNHSFSTACWPIPARPSAELLKRLAAHSEKWNRAADEMSKRITSLRRETIERPVIYIGCGTCGLGAGAAATLESIRRHISENKIDAELVEVGCIGLCSEEPIVDIQLPGRTRVSFRHVTDKNSADLLNKVFAGEIPADMMLGQFEDAAAKAWDNVPLLKDHPFFAPQTRWVLPNCGLINPNDIDEYISRGGYSSLDYVLHNLTPMETCDMVEKAGLRGRGGGGFPAATKWKIAHKQGSDQKYLICNADEGDPGAFMDRAVIEGDPHRLLEGMAIAAYAIGASKAYVYIRAEYPLAIKNLEIAIEQAKEYGLLGGNILDSNFKLEIKLKKGAGAFVCGEETALMNSIEGKRGMPRPRPPYPAVSGLFGKPSIVNNVETLANLPMLVALTAEKFASVGTESSKGTKVFALSGKVTRTGLVEVAMGTKIRDIVFAIGGGAPNGKEFKAVQIGGPSGGCIPESHIDIQIDYESLKKVGAMMGSGGLVVMDEDTCMVDLAKYFMDFIQRESCGKCIPCREGTRRMLEVLETITHGRKSENDIDALLRFRGVMYIESLAEVIRDTALCGLGQSAPNPVLSTLRWFRDEYEAHIYERKCPAKACPELVTYRIIEDKCTGCTVCARKCPTEAIMGAKKSPHYIVSEKCIRCGACMETCRFNAIVVE